ncbi:MAG: hypothetical protein ACE37K_18410 [Planctomycetota bacterium]
MPKLHRCLYLAAPLTMIACSTQHATLPRAVGDDPASPAWRGSPSAAEPFASTAPASRTVRAPERPPVQEPEAKSSGWPRDDAPWEITVGGAGASNDDFDAGGAQLGVTVGYYLNPVVQVSFRQNGWFSDAGPSMSEQWNGASRFAIDLHVPGGPVQPYIGANVGYVYGDSVKETMVAGPEAGVKFYLQDDAFLQAGAEYQFFFDEDDSLEAAFDDGQVLYALTMGLRF